MIDPSPANFQAFKELPRDEPLHMFNLLRFRDLAEYPEGHKNAGMGWSGVRAYQEYGARIANIFERVGARIIWRGDYRCMVTGPDGEHWHAAFIVEYRDAHAFFEMVKDPEYQLAVVNRTAALADSRLVRFLPGTERQGF